MKIIFYLSCFNSNSLMFSSLIYLYKIACKFYYDHNMKRILLYRTKTFFFVFSLTLLLSVYCNVRYSPDIRVTYSRSHRITPATCQCRGSAPSSASSSSPCDPRAQVEGRRHSVSSPAKVPVAKWRPPNNEAEVAPVPSAAGTAATTLGRPSADTRHTLAHPSAPLVAKCPAPSSLKYHRMLSTAPPCASMLHSKDMVAFASSHGSFSSRILHIFTKASRPADPNI